MSLIDISQNSDDNISADLPMTISKCPLCNGSGIILCNKTNTKVSCFFSTPMQPEEKCSCCDGKGWVTQIQRAKSRFCRIR